MATRTVTGDVVKSDGDPWPDGDLSYVQFKILEGTWSSTEHAPPDRTIATLTSGAYSADLYAPATYEVTMPNGYVFEVDVPEGSSATLETLRAATEAVPTVEDLFTTTASYKSYAVVAANDGDRQVGDYTTLAAALTAGEKWIALKPGTYTGGVTISQDDVKIFAYGATWTENVAGSTLTISGARVHIEGLHISGSHDGDDGDMIGGSAMLVTGDGFSAHRCRFTNLQGYAVNVSSADDVEVSHCRAVNVATAASPAKHTRYCFYFTGSLRARVHHNYVTGWSQAIGFWFGTNDSVAAYNRLVNNLGHESGAVRRSACEDYGDSVQNTDNKWLYNYVDGTTGNCMELAQGLKGTLVQGNTFKGAGTGYTTAAFPVFVTGGDGGAGGLASDNVQIIANRIYGRNDSTVADGIGSSGLIDGLLIQDNELYDFLNSGTPVVFIQGGASVTQKVVIRGNTFRNVGNAAGSYVIRLSVDNCVVEGNDIVSAIAGVRGIYGDSSNGHTIKGNTIDVLATAMDLDDDNIVTGNTVVSTSSSKAVIIGGGNIVTGNRLTGDDDTTGIAGVLSIEGNRNQVKDNYIHRDPATATGWGAVISCDTTDNRIEGNTLESGANNDTVVLFGTNSRRNVLVGNTHIRPDNALGITDNDGTASNSKNYNHTLTTLGTW